MSYFNFDPNVKKAEKLEIMLKNATGDFWHIFLPVMPTKNSEEQVYRQIYIASQEGFGKSVFIRQCAHKIISLARLQLNGFCINKLNFAISKNLSELLDLKHEANGWINFLVLEDSDSKSMSSSKKLLEKKIRIRHADNSTEDSNYGITYLLFLVQDYFLVGKKLRSSNTLEVVKSPPTAPSDYYIFRSLFGIDALKMLREIAKERIEKGNNSALQKSIFRSMTGRVGYVDMEGIEAFKPSWEKAVFRRDVNDPFDGFKSVYAEIDEKNEEKEETLLSKLMKLGDYNPRKYRSVRKYAELLKMEEQTFISMLRNEGAECHKSTHDRTYRFRYLQVLKNGKPIKERPKRLPLDS